MNSAIFLRPRLKNIYPDLARQGCQALIVSSWPNISYLTQFISRDSYLLVSKKTNVYFTDSRYSAEVKIGLKGIVKVRENSRSLYRLIADTCIELGLKGIGFEEEHLTFDRYKEIKKWLGKKAELIPTAGLVEKFRQIKTREELEKIREATRIAIKAIEFIKRLLLPGKKEIEIAAELERFIRYHGASHSAFEIIVASGPNSSYPHHLTSQRRIRNNEPVLIDLGVDYQGYKSDLTRVFFLGKITPIFRRVYSIVKEAQARAISKVKPGAKINQIDAASRQYITQRGYAGFFGHNLGHGVGREVHEQPCVSQEEKGHLKTGMVFTLEPGIYLPGKFGVRIEDLALVTQKGVELLSGSLDK